MSDSTSVDQGLMAQGISDLDTAHRNVSSDLSDLEHEVETSLAEWTGDAREAYTQAKAQWNKAADHMTQVIATMKTTMDGIANRYNDNERHVQGLFG